MPIDVTLPGILKLLSLLHSEKAHSPINVTLSGTDIFFKELKPSKVYAGITVPPVMVIVSRALGIFLVSPLNPLMLYVLSDFSALSPNISPSHVTLSLFISLSTKPANGSESSSSAVHLLNI